MIRNEKGFTLIELVIIIVILGLLSAVALPKYQDLRTEAAQAAAEGVYGAANAATAINFAAGIFSASIPDITTAAQLIAAMDSTPDGWTDGGATTMTNTAFGYTISVNAPETATTKARLRKSGF